VIWLSVFGGGIKMLSNLRGFPSMFLELAMAYCVIKVAMNPKKYDAHKEDYTEDGRLIEIKNIQIDNQTIDN
jgi:hypothetical protein